VLFLALMLALVRALEVYRGVMILGMALVVAGFLYETGLDGGFVVDRPGVLALLTFGYLLLVGAAAFGLLRRVLGQKTVTAETVRGGIAVYFLLAIVWSLLFEIVAIVLPGSFAGFAIDAGVDQASVRGRYLYFSLTTLTTLGYGDIVPTTSFARNLATLEAVCGQIFLAVFMARLIAIRVGQELKQH